MLMWTKFPLLFFLIITVLAPTTLTHGLESISKFVGRRVGRFWFSVKYDTVWVSRLFRFVWFDAIVAFVFSSFLMGEVCLVGFFNQYFVVLKRQWLLKISTKRKTWSVYHFEKFYNRLCSLDYELSSVINIF